MTSASSSPPPSPPPPPPSPSRRTLADAATAIDAARWGEENRIESVALQIGDDVVEDSGSGAGRRSLGSRASATLRRWGRFLAAQHACLLCLSLLCCLVILITILVIIISGHDDGDRTLKLINYFEQVIAIAKASG